MVDTVHGRTPLLLAIKNRREGIVRILLEQNGIDPNQDNVSLPRTSSLTEIRLRMLIQQ